MAYYGNVFNADSLGNLQVGGSNSRVVSLRFRSRGGTLNSLVLFFVFTSSPGYFGGTGGSVRVDLETDDGSGNPSGTVLATAALSSMLSANFRTVTWASPPALTAGSLYHIVCTNTDGAPATNYVSVDDIVTDVAQTPRQPTLPDSDLAALTKDGASAWALMNLHTPIFRAVYADGGIDGQTYRDVRSGSGLNNIGGANMVRELFTVTGGNRVVGGAWVRLYRQAGTAADLVGTLKDSIGTVLETATVPASSFTIGEAGAIRVWFPFAANRTLTSGATYSFELSSTETANPYKIFPLQDGSATLLLTCPTQFDDGKAQFSTNSGSTWSDGANGLVQSDFDWQIYFEGVNTVADFVYTNEGKDLVNTSGWPATVYFLLSTQVVGTTFTATSTLAGGVGEITGTGYARKSQAKPASSAGQLAFTQMSWATGSAVDWPATVASVIACSTPDNTGKTLAGWNLQAGGTVRAMNAANTTENVTPTFTA